jgi:hypothetical protein
MDGDIAAAVRQVRMALRLLSVRLQTGSRERPKANVGKAGAAATANGTTPAGSPRSEAQASSR